MADADARIGGRYRLERELAAGGMGTVWQGWDERLQRAVAVKKLHLQPGLPKVERDVAVQRAMREARITARLHHPNAVTVFDVVDEGDAPCLIMQYVPSRSLQDIVIADGPLSVTDVARVGTQVAAALAAAHRAGIVHRDVKPANVLIAQDGTAKITDFGISHAFDDVTLTGTGMVSGTPGYLAPEVARGAASSFASDVYSLGATLFMAVEGRPPFGTDPNPMAVLHRVASGASEQPTRTGPLTALLQRMMCAQPTARPSMVDVANGLAEFHAGTPDDATGPTQLITRQRPIVAPRAPVAVASRPESSLWPPNRAPTPRAQDRPPHRSWLPILAAAVVIMLGVLLAGVLLNTTGGNGNTASGNTSAGRSPTPSTTTHSPSSGSPSPPTSASRASVQPGQPTDQQLAQAVIDYFRLIPGNLDAGWMRLTAHFQTTRAQSRQVYDSYWNSVERVDASAVTGRAPGKASATLTYHLKDGRVVTEQTQFHLIRQGNLLKIDWES